MKFRGIGMSFAASAAISLFSCLPSASAAPTGFSTTNCPGGGVIVTASTIDFTLPVGGPDGCIVTGIGTNVPYPAGTLGPATYGRILDLPPVIPGVPVLNFMTFNSGPGPTNPGLSFDLVALGPGSPNLTCGPNVGDSCSAFAGSPFVLTRTKDVNGVVGTSVTLAIDGNERYLGAIFGTYNGSLTTQLAGRTPEQVIANINSGGSESSSDSGSFITVSAVPEPGTITMSMLGGLMVAAAAFRRARS